LARSNVITAETGAQCFFAQIGHGIVKVSFTVKTQIDFKGTPVGEPITELISRLFYSRKRASNGKSCS